MKDFVVNIVWSQTDNEFVLVRAESKKDAQAKVREKFPHILFIMGTREINYTIT